jgi:hypothetical protein
MITESVSGRTILRGRDTHPERHIVRYYSTRLPHPDFRDGGIRAACDAGDLDTILDGGHTGEELHRFARQHAGIEDP